MHLHKHMHTLTYTCKQRERETERKEKEGTRGRDLCKRDTARKIVSEALTKNKTWLNK